MGVVEFEYITKNMTPERSMRVCREWDQMVCKLLPDFFTNNERLEGNGELGTVSAVTLGHAMGPAAGAKFKKRVTVFDEENCIYCYEHVNDLRYRKFHVTMRFSPGPDRSTTTLDWKLEYEPTDPSTAAPGKIKQVAMKVCDAIQHYITEHPNWP